MTRTEKIRQNLKIREKRAKEVQDAMLAPSLDAIMVIASKLPDKDLRAAALFLAEKCGKVDTMKAIAASLDAVERAVPDVKEAILGASGETQPLSLALPRPAFKSTPESRLARVYGRPINQRMRLIEFDDDRTHGTLWVKEDSPVWIGWTIWAKPNPEPRGGWILDGVYSPRGIRLR